MNATTQRVIFLSGDLIFAGRVRAACESAGYIFTFAASLPDSDPSDPELPSGVRYVILDLSTRSGIMQQLPDDSRRIFPQARVIAYAPHVHKERLAAARGAGFDEVMTRGQFDMWIGRLASEA